MVLSDLNLGKIGFNLGKVPMNEDEDVVIEDFIKLVDEFIGSGFNYFDSSYRFEDAEYAFDKAVNKRYDKDAFRICGKMAAWYRTRSRVSAVSQFDESILKTGIRNMDMLALEEVGGEKTLKFDEYDLWSFMETKKKTKRVKCIGIYFKGDATELEGLIKQHILDFIQLDMNVDGMKNDQNMIRCYEVARQYGKPVIGIYSDNSDLTIEEQIKSLKYISELEGVESVVVELDSVEKVKQYAHMLK